MKLDGKNVLVTGAAKRVGRAIALAFAEKEANVLIHYNRSAKEARSLVNEIISQGVESEAYSADLSDVSDLKKMTAKILKKWGRVDVLIHNASLFYPTPFSEVKEKDWDAFLDIHVKAPFFLAQALAPAMKKQGAGRILHIADWSGLKPYRDYLPYCVSKGALLTMTQALAKTLAPEILVTAVCPGPVLAPPSLKEEAKRRTAEKTLVGRWGSPQDVARMAVFLAEQDFVTGSYHLVDGGELLKG